MMLKPLKNCKKVLPRPLSPVFAPDDQYRFLFRQRSFIGNQLYKRIV